MNTMAGSKLYAPSAASSVAGGISGMLSFIGQLTIIYSRLRHLMRGEAVPHRNLHKGSRLRPYLSGHSPRLEDGAIGRSKTVGDLPHIGRQSRNKNASLSFSSFVDTRAAVVASPRASVLAFARSPDSVFRVHSTTEAAACREEASPRAMERAVRPGASPLHSGRRVLRQSRLQTHSRCQLLPT